MSALGPNPNSERSAQILKQLETVLGHPLFTRAPRQSQFLRFIVETSLEGRQEELREHHIGVQVYERKADYDTREDPIVRVEAARLRAKLREYYAEAGLRDPIRFELPKGTYIPVLHQNSVPIDGEAAEGEPAEAARQERSDEPPAADGAPPAPPPEAPPAPRGARRISRRVLGLAAAILAGAILLFAYVWSTGRLNSGPRAGQPRSLAVLPFTDLSEGQENRMFCEGLTDQITDELSRIADLQVAGRTSAAQFEGKRQDLRNIGQTLGVTHILEGSVRMSGKKVRVTSRLVDVRTGFQLWSATLEKEKEDVFSLQDEIARAMSRTLQVRLTARKQPDSAANTPQRLKAQELFLQAKAVHRRMNPSSLSEARALHERAAETDPSYALAHSGLAHIYVSIAGAGLEASAVLRDRARSAARRAVELDPGLADGYSALIRLARDMDYDWPTAISICQDAAAVAPNAATVATNCGTLFMILGRHEEAAERFRSAMRLDPLWAGAAEAYANGLAWSGKLREAETQIRAVRSTHPDYIPALYAQARILALQERYTEALALFDERSDRGHPLSAGHLSIMALLAAKANQGGRASAIRTQLERRAAKERILHADLALVYFGLGMEERAVAMLEDAVIAREPGLGEVLTDPLLAPLRTRPNFTSLLTRINLPR